MEKFETKNYHTWEQYKEEHPEIAEIKSAEKIQAYEDQVFSLMMRLFR